MLAGEMRKQQVVKALIALKVDVNERDIHGKTALMFAVKAEFTGADINSKDKEGRTALSYAKEAMDKVMIKLLIDTGAA
jgi:ankyrin repeat protein